MACHDMTWHDSTLHVMSLYYVYMASQNGGICTYDKCRKISATCWVSCCQHAETPTSQALLNWKKINSNSNLIRVNHPSPSGPNQSGWTNHSTLQMLGKEVPHGPRIFGTFQGVQKQGPALSCFLKDLRCSCSKGENSQALWKSHGYDHVKHCEWNLGAGTYLYPDVLSRFRITSGWLHCTDSSRVDPPIPSAEFQPGKE